MSASKFTKAEPAARVLTLSLSIAEAIALAQYHALSAKVTIKSPTRKTPTKKLGTEN
jgi:hypothetical protein